MILDYPQNIYIEILCLSVCLDPINVKTSKPIGANFCEATYMTHGKEYGQFKLEKICLKKTVYIC